MKKVLFILSIIFSLQLQAQSVQDLINQVNLVSLEKTLNEFSGEVSTIVAGNTVNITNRQHANNGLAGDYLVGKFEELDNITVTDQAFNTTGRNIIGTQLGKTNPDNIYIICAHYDSVANYCADDNVSGTAAVLEIARILSKQCLDNTIVYALWDEEEIGLRGAAHYASLANTNGDNILGVLNLDMMAHDDDGDKDFDIDVRPIANSIAMKDDIVNVLNTYAIDLNVNVVNPGTPDSDHSRFWDQGFSAVLVGESWANNDQTQHYHTSGDRVSTLNLPYYHKLVQVVMGYMATKGGLNSIDNSVTQTGAVLTATQAGASYQWINCDTNTSVSGATDQSFTVTTDGNYAVQVTSGSCTENSECLPVSVLNVNEVDKKEYKIYPNSIKSILNIEVLDFSKAGIQITNTNGQVVFTREIEKALSKIDISSLSKGVYFVKLTVDDFETSKKIIKE